MSASSQGVPAKVIKAAISSPLYISSGAGDGGDSKTAADGVVYVLLIGLPPLCRLGATTRGGFMFYSVVPESDPIISALPDLSIVFRKIFQIILVDFYCV